jgi:hypothetical protein
MVGYFYSYIVNADDIFLKNRDMAGEREKRDGFQYMCFDGMPPKNFVT